MSGSTFWELASLTSEDKVLPTGDGFNHNGTMIPSWNLIVDVWVIPFLGVQVEDYDVVVLALRVPATVNVELSTNSKHCVATSGLRWVVGILNLFPMLRV
jgi:hypothetical protein